MKPKLFIGSSTEGKDIADAIHTNLQNEAECTPWPYGVFGLSEGYIQSLIEQVNRSDFGVFVFSPEDAVKIREKLFSVPRDNVVYELGLFSGALGADRCFFVTPQDTDIHLPSDLLGMTAGGYETKRQYQNLQAAVGPFCAKVRAKIREFTVRFVHPEPGAKLTPGWQTFTLECGARPGRDLFFLTRTGDRWWPRRDPLDPADANKYKVQFWLTTGFQELCAVKANPLGMVLLNFYLNITQDLRDSGLSKDGLQKHGLWYPGLKMEELPRGITLLDSIRFEVVAMTT